MTIRKETTASELHRQLVDYLESCRLKIEIIDTKEILNKEIITVARLLGETAKTRKSASVPTVKLPTKS